MAEAMSRGPTNKTASPPDYRELTSFVTEIDLFDTYGAFANGFWINDAGGGSLYLKSHSGATAVKFTVQSNTLLPVQARYIADAGDGTDVTSVVALFPERLRA